MGASNLKIWQVLDDKFILKQISTVSMNSQVFHLAFDQNDEKIASLTKSGIEIFDYSDNDYPNSIAKFNLPEDIPIPNYKFVRFELFGKFFFTAYEKNLYKMNLTGQILEKFENVTPEVISAIQFLPKHNFLLVSGGKITRVLKI